MSSRARRIEGSADMAPFTWGDQAATPVEAAPAAPRGHVTRPAAPAAADPAGIEREAFAKGFAQGERAGEEAAAARADTMLRRLGQTIEELQALRSELVRRAERELVELSLAIARKVVQREVSLDHELLQAMARVALERLADTNTASIRLHPEDYAATVGARGALANALHGVQLVADPAVRRGGCVVQSESGAIDVGVAAQLDELTAALLGDESKASGPALLHSIRRDDAA